MEKEMPRVMLLLLELVLELLELQQSMQVRVHAAIDDTMLIASNSALMPTRAALVSPRYTASGTLLPDSAVVCVLDCIIMFVAMATSSSISVVITVIRRKSIILIVGIIVGIATSIAVAVVSNIMVVIVVVSADAVFFLLGPASAPADQHRITHPRVKNSARSLDAFLPHRALALERRVRIITSPLMVQPVLCIGVRYIRSGERERCGRATAARPGPPSVRGSWSGADHLGKIARLKALKIAKMDKARGVMRVENAVHVAGSSGPMTLAVGLMLKRVAPINVAMAIVIVNIIIVAIILVAVAIAVVAVTGTLIIIVVILDIVSAIDVAVIATRIDRLLHPPAGHGKSSPAVDPAVVATALVRTIIVVAIFVFVKENGEYTISVIIIIIIALYDLTVAIEPSTAHGRGAFAGGVLPPGRESRGGTLGRRREPVACAPQGGRGPQAPRAALTALVKGAIPPLGRLPPGTGRVDPEIANLAGRPNLNMTEMKRGITVRLPSVERLQR